MLKYLSVTPLENFGGAENSTENSGPHAKNYFCSIYEMSQRHPVWLAENHVKPCNSVYTYATYVQCVRGEGVCGYGLQTDKHLPQSFLSTAQSLLKLVVKWEVII